MPFIAHQDGDTVIPEQIDDQEDVYCRTCDGRMRARGPSKDGRARHFVHVDGDRSECYGGGGSGPAESATHLKWKSLAVSALRQRYDDYERCSPEIPIGVSSTETDVDERRADALLEFEGENRFYGRGIIVEVQHLNVSKDIRGTTHDYLKEGYSVYWATEDDFEGDKFLVDRMEAAFNDDRRSAFSVYRSEPPRLDAPEPLSVLEDDGRVYTTANLVPECSHEYIPTDAGRECVRCGLQLRMCVYDPYKKRFYPDPSPSEYPSLERVFAADRGTINRPIEFQEVEEYGTPPEHSHHWGQPNDVFGGKKYRCMLCDATLITGSGRVVLNHE